MFWLPYHHCTLVSPYAAQELYAKLRPEIHTGGASHEPLFLAPPRSKTYLFEGVLRPERFQIWTAGPYPEHFSPHIWGKIEETSRGSILSLTYRLPSGTMFVAFLATFVFWCTALAFWLVEGNAFSGSLFLAFWVGSYVVMMLNFSQKLRRSEGHLHRILQ
ncbi:MAG: hypothetical protein OHK0053_32780 [Microscillaceae bacterium]